MEAVVHLFQISEPEAEVYSQTDKVVDTAPVDSLSSITALVVTERTPTTATVDLVVVDRVAWEFPVVVVDILADLAGTQRIPMEEVPITQVPTKTIVLGQMRVMGK